MKKHFINLNLSYNDYFKIKDGCFINLFMFYIFYFLFFIIFHGLFLQFVNLILYVINLIH